MKILFSQIQKLIPELKATPKEVANILTNIGFLNDSLETVSFDGKEDYLIGLEIRQNRADLLSYWGIAREVAAYYGLALELPVVDLALPSAQKKDIKINDDSWVKRVMAINLTGIKKSESPAWLQESLSLQGTKSINLAVDLSNFVMFLTGYPSHLLDQNKITGNVSWSLNSRFKEITTLDSSKFELKGQELIIEDEENILALAGLIGGQAAAIEIGTDSVLVEMAVYERSLVKKNARDLKITTEAGIRLEKTLDPNSLETAFRLLISLLLEHTGAEMGGEIFEYYPEPPRPIEIDFDWEKAGTYAGIPIKKEQCLAILKNLRFTVTNEGEVLKATPPQDRTDIFLEEDVIEEVIRMVGYDQIPWNELPKMEIITEITPPITKTERCARNLLTSLGLDEILSLPLVPAGAGQMVNYRELAPVITQNAINEERPELRLSLATGLLEQNFCFNKNNVNENFLFEIGKVFGKEKTGSGYWEKEALGILLDAPLALGKIKSVVEKLLRGFGFNQISYQETKIKPAIAHPDVCFTITVNQKEVGIIYKLVPQDERPENIYFAELDLELITKEALGESPNPAVEITQKLVILDANLELKDQKELQQKLAEITAKIGEENIWSLNIKDAYQLEDRIRYTVRTTYQNLGDQEAKKIHLAAFGLV
jgi:phenylalanyl-tRNA synthetase beta subunit